MVTPIVTPGYTKTRNLIPEIPRPVLVERRGFEPLTSCLQSVCFTLSPVRCRVQNVCICGFPMPYITDSMCASVRSRGLPYAKQSNPCCNPYEVR